MKCLIFSDSHGDAYFINEALRLHKDAEAVFFLGDGLSDIEPLVFEKKSVSWLFVRGNCDFRDNVLGEPAKKTDEICLFGKKIVLTHGDMYGAKLGMDRLVYLAEERAADIVLFGHTHRAEENYISVSERGVYFLNPGSISSSHGNKPTYGILSISEDVTLFSIGSFI